MVDNWHLNSMKKRSFILTLLAIVATFGLVSCEKNEDKIIGTWECTSAELIDPEEGDELDMAGSVFVFKDDNTVTVSDDGETQSGTYTVNDDNLVITLTVHDEGMTATFRMDVELLEINNSNMSIEGKIDIVFGGQVLDSTQFKASFKKK